MNKSILIGAAIGISATLLLTHNSDDKATPTDLSSRKPSIDMPHSLPLNMDTATPSNRLYVIKARLSQVLAALSMPKMMIAQHHQMNGSFPNRQSDFDISMFDLNEYDVIDNAYFTEQGALGVDLSDDFGKQKRLTLHPSESKNGAFIKWSCSTNIDKKYLGTGNAQICEYNAHL